MTDKGSKAVGTYPEALEDPEARLNPFDWYSEQRGEGGIRYDDHRECYDVFDYETVKAVLSDPETFSSDPTVHPEITPENTPHSTDSMLYEDPPRHTELRGTVEDFFKPGEIADLEPEIEGIAGGLLENALEGPSGTFDVVRSVAYPLPITVIGRLLGVPPEDGDKLRKWSMQLVSPQDAVEDEDVDPEDVQLAAGRKLNGYFEDLLETRREDPRDDLLSRIATESDLAPGEALGFCQLLLLAGNVTTTNLITNAIWTLGERGLWEDLRGDEQALELAIEEVLRYRTPGQATQRWTTEPVTLGDQEIPAKSTVVVWLGSANRDETAFEAADEFVRDRQPNRHVAFGHGIHTCLGAPLARLEARIALQTLLDRFETVDPVTDDLQALGSPKHYAPRSLPVRYETK